MLTEKEIKEKIEKTTKNFQHVLDCGPATVQINAPRALMQLSAVSQLNTLYEVLGKQRPKFECDDKKKTDY